jgi:hypothetical protein
MVNLIKLINAPLTHEEIIQNTYSPMKKSISLTISSTLVGHTWNNTKYLNKHLIIAVELFLITIRLTLGIWPFQVQ